MNGWTWSDYWEQPEWFIAEIVDEMAAQAKRMAEATKGDAQEGKYKGAMETPRVKTKLESGATVEHREVTPGERVLWGVFGVPNSWKGKFPTKGE